MLIESLEACRALENDLLRDIVETIGPAIVSLLCHIGHFDVPRYEPLEKVRAECHERGKAMKGSVDGSPIYKVSYGVGMEAK